MQALSYKCSVQRLAWRELLRDEGPPQRQLLETRGGDEAPRGAGVRTDRCSESSGTTSLASQVRSRSGAPSELTLLDSRPEEREQACSKPVSGRGALRRPSPGQRPEATAPQGALWGDGGGRDPLQELLRVQRAVDITNQARPSFLRAHGKKRLSHGREAACWGDWAPQSTGTHHAPNIV